MREIKFRGRTVNGKWLYGNLQVPSVNGVPYYMWDEDKFQCSVDENTIGQYTGLRDKYGKEIYEGDVVEVTQLNGCNVAKRGIVEYRESNCRYVIRITTPIYRDIFIFRELTNGLCEDNDGRCTIKWHNEYVVLGNIHDNPELIKE